jgi:hypothetical protein
MTIAVPARAASGSRFKAGFKKSQIGAKGQHPCRWEKVRTQVLKPPVRRGGRDDGACEALASRAISAADVGSRIAYEPVVDRGAIVALAMSA